MLKAPLNLNERVLCFVFSIQQDKANTHKKLLDDAEEQFRFKEEAKDLVKFLSLFLLIGFSGSRE